MVIDLEEVSEAPLHVEARSRHAAGRASTLPWGCDMSAVRTFREACYAVILLARNVGPGEPEYWTNLGTGHCRGRESQDQGRTEQWVD